MAKGSIEFDAFVPITNEEFLFRKMNKSGKKNRIKIIQCLIKTREGLRRIEIKNQTNIKSDDTLTRVLRSLKVQGYVKKEEKNYMLTPKGDDLFNKSNSMEDILNTKSVNPLQIINKKINSPNIVVAIEDIKYTTPITEYQMSANTVNIITSATIPDLNAVKGWIKNILPHHIATAADQLESNIKEIDLRIIIKRKRIESSLENPLPNTSPSRTS